MLRVTGSGLPQVCAAIQTERLRLVALTGELARLAGDDRREFLSRLQLAEVDAWLDAEKLETLSLFLERLTQEIEAAEQYFVIIEAAEHAAIGDLAFRLVPAALKTCEIGYFIVANRRGRGYATEAARALLGWATGAAGMSCVELRCDRENMASQRIAEKLGMRVQGRNGDQLLWQLGLREPVGHQDRAEHSLTPVTTPRRY
jgi:RimJ/RimL family protein N-acetyltransferase